MMETGRISDSASATLHDLTDDWSYMKTTDNLPRSMPPQAPESPALSVSSRTFSEWHTSDYAPSTSSEVDEAVDGDTTNTDDDPTIVGVSHGQDTLGTFAGGSLRLRSFSAVSKIHVQSEHGHAATKLNFLQRETEAQYTQIAMVQSSISQALRSINDFKLLTSLKENLVTPINGPALVHTVNRFAEENLPPYDRAIVAAKLEKLHELETKIQDGCQRYDVVRNLLMTEQWTKQQALQHWDKMYNLMACNEERSAADHLLATVPFQIPNINVVVSTNTKRRGRPARETQASDVHLRANARAKSWRGHVKIRENHLQGHLRVFELDALPELPKEVMLPTTDLQVDEEQAQAGSLDDGLQDLLLSDDDMDGGRMDGIEDISARESLLNLMQRDRLVKSHSKKALQVLGIKS